MDQHNSEYKQKTKEAQSRSKAMGSNTDTHTKKNLEFWAEKRKITLKKVFFVRQEKSVLWSLDQDTCLRTRKAFSPENASLAGFETFLQ